MIKLLKIENNSMYILLDDKHVKTTLNIPDLGFTETLNYSNGELFIDGEEVVDATTINNVESYIDNYDFPDNSIHGLKNCVDSNLNYLGFVDNSENEFTEVAKVPSLKINNPFWHNDSFVEGCLINVTTKHYKALGQADGVNFEYAPLEGLPEDFEPYVYKYTDSSWTVDLEDVKEFYMDLYEDEIIDKSNITSDETNTLNNKKDSVESASTLDEIIGII